MKNIGQQVKEFRESKGWTWVRMAAEVSKHSAEPVSRVVLKQLEDAGDRMPSYLRALSKTMGVSSDTLLDGLYSPPGTQDLPPTAAQEERAPYTVVTPTQGVQALQQALLVMPPAAREDAATLLSSMARNPEGQWAMWLSDLIQRKLLSINEETGNTDRQGNHSADSSNQEPTIEKKQGAVPGAAMATALKGGDDFNKSPGTPESRSGDNT